MIFNERNHFEDSAHEALVGVWWSGILLKQQARNFFKDKPISESEFNVLMALRYAEKDLSQKDLSEKLLVDKSNVTALIDSLEKHGMVKRHKIPEDRRYYRIALTSSGNKFLKKVEMPYLELIHRIMSVFSPAEMKRLSGYMERLQSGISEENNHQ